MRWASRILALFGALTILGTALTTGALPLGLGLVLALLPVPAYVLLVLALDRFEPEPSRLLLWAFAWGALGATFLAGLLNDAGGQTLAVWTGGTPDDVGAVLVAPVVEETLKGALLFALFWWKRDEFDGPVDGVIYGAMTALGFATVENVMYYADEAMTGGAGGATGLFLLRGLLGGLGHPLYTAMTGIGLGFAVGARSRVRAVLYPLVGLATAIALHASWNFGAVMAEETEGISFLLTYGLVYLPALAACLWVAVRALRAEGRRIGEHLAPDVADGHLPAPVHAALATVWSRMGASGRALRRGGLRTWRAQRAFHRAASEEGLRRWRATVGRDADASRRLGYLALLAACAPADPAGRGPATPVAAS